MKILMIAQEPPMAPDQVVTGNALRAAQLSDAISGAGHTVTHLWHAPEARGGEGSFANRDELRSLLTRHAADVHLVNFWELLGLMPFDSDVPLVLDFIAPRPLEQLFQDPAQVQNDLARLETHLSRADLVLVGNEYQKQLLLLPLLGAGIDLRGDDIIEVVPLAAQAAGSPKSDPVTDGWTLVSGGVDWPWRRSQRYLDALHGLHDGQGREITLVQFGGDYRHGGGRRKQPPAEAGGTLPLQSYASYCGVLGTQAHIGLELAEENIERRHSQSFRSLDFLRHGLPLICNRYLPIAAQIERYDAGWLVDDPQELPALLESITASADAWRLKSANALRLMAEQLNPRSACQPLLRWLDSPRKARRLPWKPPAVAQLADPPPLRRARRMLGLAGMAVRRRLFSLQKKWFGGHKDKGIVVVTRGDLFPTDHGAAVKIVETARGLSRHGHPVALVTDDRRYWWRVENGVITRQRIPLWLRFTTWPAVWVKAKHYTRDIPESNAFLYLPMTDGSFFWRTIYAGRKIGAHIIQAEFPAYVRPSIPASHVLDARVVLVEHNVEYARIRAQVPELTEEQYQRYKAIEIDLANQCDAVICVSDNDRQQLASDGVALGRLHTIPHGVDLEQFEQPALKTARQQFEIPADAPLLVYHGTFSYPPNLEALDVFAHELLPRLDNMGLECHVLAVGREPPDASPHTRIHLTGSVEQVAPWLKAADIAVVPLMEGGGTRMKIIDCFAAGIPCISTSKGIEGIPAVSGRHALIIDDWNEMAEAIRALLANPDKAKLLSDAASEMAAALDWKAIARRYLDLFARL
ncbi:MAG: glycosyltransferase [Xanthomonadales bacterium]|nr:glycosyltransferase [Xanthomonadales bacterium]NNL94098.1 glycosyltransferase [Xanthomonadales bacterium]